MSRNTFLFAFVLTTLAAIGLVLAMNGVRSRADSVALEARVKEVETRLAPGRDLEPRLERMEAVVEALKASPAAAATEGEEETSIPPESRIADLESRVSTLAERLKGLEGDPISRGYAFLSSQNAEVRREGIKSLRKVSRGDSEARAAIRKMLKDPVARVRLQALSALRKMRDKESVAEITRLMDDPDAMVRGQAIRSLGEMGTRDAAPMIGQKLLADPDDNVRRIAAHAAGVLKASEVSEGLVTLLKDPNEDIRGEAIASLGEAGALSAAPLLRAIYDQEPGRHRTRLAVALKRLGDDGPFQQETTRLSQSALRDPASSARRQAVEALAAIARQESQEVFKQALQDQSQEVRRAAERAILK